MISNRSRSGDNSISSSGDNNNITLNNYNVIPKRTIIFDLCELIANENIPSGDYSIKENGNWSLKLSFNNVNEYLDVFDDYCDIYLEFEEILNEQYSDREKMVRKIHHIYRHTRIDNPDNKLDGDFILQNVFNELKKVVSSANFDPTNQIEEEEIDRTLILIMFYTFTKCKLLEIPDR